MNTKEHYTEVKPFTGGVEYIFYNFKQLPDKEVTREDLYELQSNAHFYPESMRLIDDINGTIQNLKLKDGDE